MPFVMTPEEMLGDMDEVDVNNYEDIAGRVQKFSQLMRFRPEVFDADEFSEGRLLRALKEASGEPARVVARCRVDGGYYDWKEFRLLSACGFADPVVFPPQRYLLHRVTARGDLMGNPQYEAEQLYVVPDAVGDHLDRMGPAPPPRMEDVPGRHGQTPREDILEALCAYAWFHPPLRGVDSVLALRDEVEARRATWELGLNRQEFAADTGAENFAPALGEATRPWMP